ARSRRCRSSGSSRPATGSSSWARSPRSTSRRASRRGRSDILAPLLVAPGGPGLVPLGPRPSPGGRAPLVPAPVVLAVFPVAAPRLWHAHFPKIVLAIALTFVLPFLALFGGEAAHELGHILLADYVSFLVIIIGLYAISGGMIVRGEIRGGPRTNTG